MKKDDAIPKTTPWGKPNHFTVLAPGIVHYDTPSHGGIWLSPEQNAKVPMRTKNRTFMRNGLHGWYEEDEDMSRITTYFPDVFAPDYSNVELPIDIQPVNRLQLVTDKLKQDRPRLSDKQALKLLNAHARDGIVFKLPKHK